MSARRGPRAERRVRSSRLAALSLSALLALAVAACDENSPYRSVTAPPLPAPTPAPTLDALYLGEGIPGVDTASATCNMEWSPAARLDDWWWRVVVHGDSIEVTVPTPDGWDEIRYAGTVTGRDFVAKWESRYLPVRVCEFAETWVSGSLSADLGSFVAHQALFYGPPEDREMAEWRWTARRQ